MNLSLLEKISRVFLFTFLGVLIPGLADVVAHEASRRDWAAGRDALIALTCAGIAAGLRAIVALLPVFPDDNHIGISKKQVS
jgi:hypothetical protein